MAYLFAVAYKEDEHVLAGMVVAEDRDDVLRLLQEDSPGKQIELLDTAPLESGETVDGVGDADYTVTFGDGSALTKEQVTEFLSRLAKTVDLFSEKVAAYAPARATFHEKMVAFVVGFGVVVASVLVWEYHQDKAFERQRQQEMLGMRGSRLQAMPNSSGGVIDMIPPGGRVNCGLTESGIKCKPGGIAE